MISDRPAPGESGVDSRDVDEASVRDGDIYFAARQLHCRSRFGWAVIGYPSGAIAERGGGPLLLRLREEVAREVAHAMSRSAAVNSTEH